MIRAMIQEATRIGTSQPQSSGVRTPLFENKSLKTLDFVCFANKLLTCSQNRHGIEHILPSNHSQNMTGCEGIVGR